MKHFAGRIKLAALPPLVLHEVFSKSEHPETVSQSPLRQSQNPLRILDFLITVGPFFFAPSNGISHSVITDWLHQKGLLIHFVTVKVSAVAQAESGLNLHSTEMYEREKSSDTGLNDGHFSTCVQHRELRLTVVKYQIYM